VVDFVTKRRAVLSQIITNLVRKVDNLSK
jgi:hypothetical protein